ncbi:MAG TPA: hypothetical protein VIV12_21970, partial [Streptosporangiaceae bacterium]
MSTRAVSESRNSIDRWYGVPVRGANAGFRAPQVLAVRDALAVVAARGVDPQQQPDAQMFAAPERVVAQG